MTENELYKFMANKLNCNEKEAKKYAEAFMEAIHHSIDNKESLTIRNFGKFYVRETSSGSTVFKFLPSRKMKDSLGYA